MAKLSNNKALMNLITKIAYAQGQDRFSAKQMKYWLIATGNRMATSRIHRTEAVSFVLKKHPNIDVHIMGKSKIKLYSYKDDTESKAKAGE